MFSPLFSLALITHSIFTYLNEEKDPFILPPGKLETHKGRLDFSAAIGLSLLAILLLAFAVNSLSGACNDIP